MIEVRHTDFYNIYLEPLPSTSDIRSLNSKLCLAPHICFR